MVEQPLASESSVTRSSLLWVSALLVSVAVGGIIFYILSRNHITTEQSNENARIAEEVDVLDYFPKFDDVLVVPVPLERDLFWIVQRAGGLMRFDSQTRVLTDFTYILPNIGGAYLTDLVQKEDWLFIGFQGGIIRHNLVTGEQRIYTVADGLVSGSNIRLTLDSFEKDILWVGTFRGLNRIDFVTGEVRTYTTFGMTGSAHEARVFGVDAEYVWVLVNANSYTNGGVARLTKKTDEWKTWGPEHFPFDPQTPQRFDSFGGASAERGEAIVEEGGFLYRYDPVRDVWSPRETTSGNKPIAQEITIANSKAYYLTPGVLHEIDLATGFEREVPGVFDKERVGLQHSLYFDVANARILVVSKTFQQKTGSIIEISVPEGEINIIAEAFVGETFPRNNLRLYDAQDNLLLLSDEEGRLRTYDWEQKYFGIALPSFYPSEARIVDDSVVAFHRAECGMLCNNERLISSTTIFSIDTGAVVREATLAGVEPDSYYFDNSLDRIFLFSTKYQAEEPRQVKLGHELLTGSSTFALVGADSWEGITPVSFFQHGRVSTSTMKNNEYTVSVPRDEQPKNAVAIVFSGPDKKQKRTTIPLGREEYSPFLGWDTTSIDLTALLFDPEDPSIAWIGTERGLIRLNMSTGETKTYTSDDALLHSSIRGILPLKDAFLIEHPVGFAIYRL